MLSIKSCVHNADIYYSAPDSRIRAIMYSSAGMMHSSYQLTISTVRLTDVETFLFEQSVSAQRVMIAEFSSSIR